MEWEWFRHAAVINLHHWQSEIVLQATQEVLVENPVEFNESTFQIPVLPEIHLIEYKFPELSPKYLLLLNRLWTAAGLR